MTQKIESDKLFIKEVFQKWYRIPEYQRPFVWGPDQVTELLDDIYGACQSNPDSQYFLGSLVLKKTEKQEETLTYTEYDLLDGQQRLTTLLLITAVVRDLTPSTNPSRIHTCQETIYQMANPDDNIPERHRIVFDIRDQVRDFIRDYVKENRGTEKTTELKQIECKSGEDISIRNMAQALLTIRNYFQNGHSLDGFFPYFRSNVLMIYVAAEQLEDAFHLFTVMNNRGIKLRNSDILKAENLAKVNDIAARTKYAKTWEQIEEYFEENFDNFLAHLRSILVKQKAGYNLLKEYEDNIYHPQEYDRNTKTYKKLPALLAKGVSTFEFIERYYNHYITLFDSDLSHLTKSYEFKNQLTLMTTGFEADIWIAPLLRYYDKFHTTELIKFLNMLDAKFSADWIIGLSPSKRIENTNAIIKEIENAVDQESLFASSVFDIKTQILKNILAGPIYGRHSSRYILLKIDLFHHGHSTPFIPPTTISTEHILPQNPDKNSKWVSDFNEQERQKWTDRLGNLILLSRRKNTSLSNLDYAQKREKYFKENIELFSKSIKIMHDYSSWTLKELKANHKDTLQRILLLYGVNISGAELDILADAE